MLIDVNEHPYFSHSCESFVHTACESKKIGEQQPSNWKCTVSSDWLVAAGQEIIEKLLKEVITDYRLGERVVITMNGVSVSVVDDGSRFLFIKMEEVHDLPVELALDHPFSNMFEPRSDRHKIVMAAPIITDAFKSKGITDKEVCTYALETMYRTHEGFRALRRFVQPAPKKDFFAVMKEASDEQWEMTCYNYLFPPRKSSYKRKVTYYGVVSFFALVSIISFIIIFILNLHKL